MRVAICVACIQDGSILLVKNEDSWILPGGKPNPGESDIDCILREIGEELPEVRIEVIRFYDTIEGQTPHRGDSLQAKVYFAEIDGKITPASEINDAAWLANPLEINLSDITRRIVQKLKSEGYL